MAGPPASETRPHKGSSPRSVVQNGLVIGSQPVRVHPPLPVCGCPPPLLNFTMRRAHALL